jgi:hypothetical protein
VKQLGGTLVDEFDESGWNTHPVSAFYSFSHSLLFWSNERKELSTVIAFFASHTGSNI